MLGQYDKSMKQTLRVFKSRQIYLPGEVLVLGGPGLAMLSDNP